jgi:ubiquinone/menaquinone biosynthesis C-methylase UbiE
MLDQARRRVRSIHTMKMSIEALNFADSALDAVWCAATILHIPRENLFGVLNGFRRVLKPGGILALNFQVGRPSELVQRQLDRRFFEYYQDSSQVSRLLRAAGFCVEAAIYGETKRNTHDLDITLKWITLSARRIYSQALRD